MERTHIENSKHNGRVEIDLFKFVMVMRSSTRACEVLNTIESTK